MLTPRDSGEPKPPCYEWRRILRHSSSSPWKASQRASLTLCTLGKQYFLIGLDLPESVWGLRGPILLACRIISLLEGTFVRNVVVVGVGIACYAGFTREVILTLLCWNSAKQDGCHSFGFAIES